MKSILAAILLVSSVSFADEYVEAGTYTADDVETNTIHSTLLFQENSKTVVFTMTTPDFTMPEPGCTGLYNIEHKTTAAGENRKIIVADMTCPLDFLTEAHVEIDITDATPEAVRQPNGVVVDVVIDAVGPDAFQFRLKKVAK